jgi:hypothetical protein
VTLDSPNANPSVRSWLRPLIAVPAVSVAIALAYLGWLFLSRAQQDRKIEEQAAAKKRSEDQQIFENLGGTSFEIVNFYAYPATIRAGEQADLCYGVSNAKAVNLEPAAKDPVWPSNSRCVKVAPGKTTSFTLTATDSGGHTKSSVITLTVQ